MPRLSVVVTDFPKKRLKNEIIKADTKLGREKNLVKKKLGLEKAWFRKSLVGKSLAGRKTCFFTGRFLITIFLYNAIIKQKKFRVKRKSQKTILQF